VLAHCWRDASVPSSTWRDRRHPRAVAVTPPLRRGIYRVQYYHVENGGAQLAKLGWRKPGSSAIVTVPPAAFVRYLPVEIEGRQVRGQELNAFFVSRQLYTLEVNTPQLRFPRHRFESRCGEPPEGASGWSYQWDFGDGASASGRVVEHEFPDMQPRQVTLTVRDQAGRQARVSRRVTHAVHPIKRITLRMEVQFENELPLFPPGGTVRLKLFVRNEGSVGCPAVLETAIRSGPDGAGAASVERQEVADLAPQSGENGAWVARRMEIPLPDGELHVDLRLLVHDRPAVVTRLAVLSSDRALGELARDSAHNLRDPSGRIVALRLADVAVGGVPPREVCDGGEGRVRVLVLEAGLGGPSPPGALPGYARVLSLLLRDAYAPLSSSFARRSRSSTTSPSGPSRRTSSQRSTSFWRRRGRMWCCSRRLRCPGRRVPPGPTRGW